MQAVLEALTGLPLTHVGSRDASVEELSAAHTEGYAAHIKERIEAGETHLDGDTVVCPQSYAAAVRAAGSALALGEALLAGEIEAGFACVRPPGHHACKQRAMGFCLFNNVAVLARFLHAHGKSVCIVDWDVHHGNGTQDIFRDDATVGYCSLHQSPLYPGTGAASETGAGNILNIPLPSGMGDHGYLEVFDRRVVPWVSERDPDVLLISAGFDAHRDDPLAGMRLSSAAFGEFTRRLPGRPILSLLEGGYDLEGLAGGVQAHVQALVDA